MATPFSRTLRSQENDRFTPELVLLVCTMSLLLAWLLWFSLAKMPIVAASDEARVERISISMSIEPTLSGEIEQNRMQLGKRVEAGDPLLILDSREDRLSLETSLERQRSLEAQLLELDGEIEARESAGTSEELGAIHQQRQIEYEVEAKQAAASAAFEEARSLRELHSQGLASDMDLLRAQAESERAAALVKSELEEIDLQNAAEATRKANQLAALQRLRRQKVETEGSYEDEKAKARKLQEDIGRKTVYAQAAGVINAVTSLGQGVVVNPGDTVGSLLPLEGPIRVAAWFQPKILFGPVEQGQPAKIWLDSNPKGFGKPFPAKVVAVASDLHQGRRRVELVLEGSHELAHGQSARVEIEVARIPAARLVLQRLLGETNKALLPKAGSQEVSLADTQSSGQR